MARRRLKIWITRAQPGADATAERVRALGHDAVLGPLLAVRNLPDVQVELAGVGALAFTSGNGVRAFAQLSGERSLKVFAVGQATALAARAAGFRSVLSSDGDVDALALGIAQRRNEIRGVVLHPGAAELAGDLPTALEKAGVPASRLVIYETAPVTLEPEFAQACADCDMVLVHSARAAKLLAGVLKANPASKMKALGLSKAVLAPLARVPLAAKAFPSMPLEAALLNSDRPYIMSLPPDIAEPTAPKDPAAYRPRALLGVSFWVMIVFGLVCVLGGVAIATLGPKLLAGRPHAAGGEAVAPAADTAPAVAPSMPAATPAATPAPPGVDVSGLSARVAALEGGEQRTAQAAAAALAAAAVVEASQSSGPFAEEIASLRAISPPSPELNALARLAEVGAPSRAALAASFPDYAARAASAAHSPGDDAGIGDRVLYALSRVVTLRRVGDVPGGAADAILARAERLTEDGDLDRALRTLDRLPPKAREALAPWRTRAERRAEIDRNAAALRARALAALTVKSGI